MLLIYNIDSLVDNTIASYIILRSILKSSLAHFYGKFQRFADILYAAAEEGGHVDPHKIE